MKRRWVRSLVLVSVLLMASPGFSQTNDANGTNKSANAVSLVSPAQAVVKPPAPAPITRSILLNSLTPGEWKVLIPYLPINVGDELTVRAEPAVDGGTGLGGPKAVRSRNRNVRSVADNTVGIRIGLNGQAIKSTEKGHFITMTYMNSGIGRLTAVSEGNLYVAQFGRSPTRLFIEVKKKGP